MSTARESRCALVLACGEGSRRLYSRLPTTDFPTHILAARAANLAVVTLDGVSWSDLGRPGRVLAALAHAGATPDWADRVSA